jgi:hypothetical protein
MRPEEIQQIIDALKQSQSDFHINEKSHYDQHQRLDRFLDLYDNTTSTVMRILLGLFVIGIVAAIALGSGWHK